MSISTSIFQPSVLTGGAFQDSLGNPVSLGYLLFTLSSESTASVLGSPTGQQIASGTTVKMSLDTNGNIWNSGSVQQKIWSNLVLNPSGTFYLVRLFNSSGLEVWKTPQTWTLPYQTTLDIGSIISGPGPVSNDFTPPQITSGPLG